MELWHIRSMSVWGMTRLAQRSPNHWRRSCAEAVVVDRLRVALGPAVGEPKAQVGRVGVQVHVVDVGERRMSIDRSCRRETEGAALKHDSANVA
jgi:hypothetical protein